MTGDADVPGEKIALITGANKGIGFEIARQLGQRGIFVLIGARDEARGQQAAATLTAEGLPVAALAIDVTDGASVAGAGRRHRPAPRPPGHPGQQRRHHRRVPGSAQ